MGEDEAAVAIAAVDEAGLVDLEEHPRMAERGGDLAGAVTGDAAAFDTDGFGR